MQPLTGTVPFPGEPTPPGSCRFGEQWAQLTGHSRRRCRAQQICGHHSPTEASRVHPAPSPGTQRAQKAAGVSGRSAGSQGKGDRPRSSATPPERDFQGPAVLPSLSRSPNLPRTCPGYPNSLTCTSVHLVTHVHTTPARSQVHVGQDSTSQPLCFKVRGGSHCARPRDIPSRSSRPASLRPARLALGSSSDGTLPLGAYCPSSGRGQRASCYHGATAGEAGPEAPGRRSLPARSSPASSFCGRCHQPSTPASW